MYKFYVAAKQSNSFVYTLVSSAKTTCVGGISPFCIVLFCVCVCVCVYFITMVVDHSIFCIIYTYVHFLCTITMAIRVVKSAHFVVCNS